MKKTSTIKDVAKYANVSVATVSNVMNNIDKTSESTKQRVLEAIKILGYHTNFTARSLVRQKSNFIGIVLSSNDKLDIYRNIINNNPFYLEFISGIEYSARKNNYDVLITGGENEKECLEWILRRNIDGIIYLGQYSDKLIEGLKEINIPFAFTDVYGENIKKYSSIGINDELGGYIAAKHLIDLGHKHIALATNDLKLKGVNYYRYMGYKKALNENHILINKNIIFQDSISYEGGYNIGTSIIKSKEIITGIVAAADIMAFGIMKALKSFKKEIPKDYSIIGFDNIKECTYINPELTTINQDIFQKGVLTANAIIKSIETGELYSNPIELPINLIVRESTRKISMNLT